MAEVVPIKVVIGLKNTPTGRMHDYPDWDTLPLAVTDRENPGDHMIVKWRYDKQVGHDDDAVDSPSGQWLGMLLVTDKFAQQAVAAFPTLVTIMTEVEAETFWETRVMKHMPEETHDFNELQGLAAERELRVVRGQVDLTDLDRKIDAALDPDNAAPGVNRFQEKTWASTKAKYGITIKP